MVLVLPAGRTALSGFTEGLTGGISNTLPESISEMFKSKRRKQEIQDILNMGKAKQNAENEFITLPQKQKDEKFIDLVQNLENQSGETFNPDQLDNLWNQLNLQNQQSQQNGSPEITEEQVIASSLNPDLKDLSQALTSLRGQQQKEHLQGKKEKFAREQTGLQETKDLRSKLSEGYRTALSNEKIYSAMKQLNQKNLAGPFKAYLADKLGVPISVLSNPESEQYQKLEQTLTRQISNYYPGQIRVVEFESFLRQIPTLLNSKEGRDRVLGTLEALDEIPKAEFETYRQIVKENGGNPPFDLNEQISEKMVLKLDEIGSKLDKAILGTEKESPKASLKDIFGE